MKRRPPTELTVTDGTRPVGRIVPRGEAFEVFGADGEYLFKVGSIREAQAALHRLDIELRSEAARRG